MARYRALVQRISPGGRLFWLLLAAAALSVLLLRPICEASPGHLNHGDRSATCCSSASQPSEARADDLLTPALQGGPVALAALSFLFLVATGFVPRAAMRFAGAPPRLLPYHARSQRVLR